LYFETIAVGCLSNNYFRIRIVWIQAEAYHLLSCLNNGITILRNEAVYSSSLLLKNTTVMWWMYALLSALFAALTAIFAKIGIKGVDTDLATAIRTSVILVLAWGIAIFRGGVYTAGSLTKQNLLFLLLSGIATGLSWIFYFKALQIGKVSQVAPVDKLSVAIAIALSVLFLGEQLTIKTTIGAGLIITGTIVLIF
jgi:transporter family protein